MIDFLIEIDRQLFIFLNGLHFPWLDPLMFHISKKYLWTPFYAILLWFFYNNYGWKTTLVILFFIIVLITMSDQISGFLKKITQRPRPVRDEELEGIVHFVNNRSGGLYGFVSSHASNSFALAVFIIHILKNKVKYIIPVMIGWACLKSYSRIYLGAHFPGDILGGILLGIACAVLIAKVWDYFYKADSVDNFPKVPLNPDLS
ncbi:MAG: phosphatase PAP2 family protein [Bacteroidetes bacterium]|nr:MAG: phosphatase PAP2 family protein [Bacteroidota bacterium]